MPDLPPWVRSGPLWGTVVSLLLVYLYFHVVHWNPQESVVAYLLQVSQNDDSPPLRLPVKVQMTDPFLLFVGYSVSYVLIEKLGLKHLPRVITPNVISCTHPFLALLAAAFIVKSFNGNKPAAAVSASVARCEPENGWRADEEAGPKHEDEGWKEDKSRTFTHPIVTFTEPDVLHNYLRAAALCLALRQVLDTLDGALARAHRNMGVHHQQGIIPLAGPSIDRLTDTLGVLVFFTALLRHLHARRPVISYAVPGGRCTPCWNRALASWHAHGHGAAHLISLTCILAFVMTGIRGLFWEYYVPLFSGLFDHSASPAAAAVEKSFAVQFMYFSWSLSCIDAILFYFIVALATNRLWSLIHFLAFAGWVWTAAVVLYTMAVQRYVMAALQAPG
eukprot:EG_transcript_12839